MTIAAGSEVRVIDSVGPLSGQMVKVVSANDLTVNVQVPDSEEVLELGRDRVSEDLEAGTQDFPREEADE